MIYSFDFGSGKGKFISTVLDGSDPYDISVKTSPKIEIRFTYIFDKKEVVGIQFSKAEKDGSLSVIHLSTLDWNGILKILYLFSNLDFSSLANNSLIIDGGLVHDPVALNKFLMTVATDPVGQEKMKEVLKNFGAIKNGDINEIVERKNAIELFEKLLNSADEFQKYKTTNVIGKNEEVWQKFFQSNSWILGSDFVEILDERVIDEESITDLPVKDYDGFVNIIELKLPTEDFWTQEMIPVSNLTKAMVQCMRYVTEMERRMNDYKKIGELGANILKPRITLIFGRSNDWMDKHREQLKILNSSFHNISILTYDHVLQRAKKITEQTKH
ncbi:MAG: DUF4263 domain-containing protein [Candidatus Shapirobacteria bacterium]|nr:DUF4263 domain-containing protein [Candidatus Shapirobacteria bacterium]